MNQEFSMMDVAPTVATVLGLPAPGQAKGKPIGRIVADLAGSARIAVLAPDALGLFAWNLWKDKMPYLRSHHESRSVILRSVMPSITPVNFATMICGTDQAGHGVETFRSEIACETIYDVVRARGGKSAGVGLSGYTGCELLGRYADICGDAGNGTDDDIADLAVKIAHDQHPEFMIVQLGQVDDVFHEFGPSSPAVIPMLQQTDHRLEKLITVLRPLGYGVIILSDHGQHDVLDAPPGEHKGTHGTDSDIDCLVPCAWI